MRKIYRSKVEGLILVPLVLVLSMGIVLLIQNQFWPGAVLGILLILFLVYLYRTTRYELTEDEKLKIRSGFLYKKEIYVKSIKSIHNTKNHLASPALSNDRIEIQFNRYERVQISPNAKRDFISELVRINPRINLGKNTGSSPTRDLPATERIR
jgi:hypothetical protein